MAVRKTMKCGCITEVVYENDGMAMHRMIERCDRHHPANDWREKVCFMCEATEAQAQQAEAKLARIEAALRVWQERNATFGINEEWDDLLVATLVKEFGVTSTKPSNGKKEERT